MEADILLTGGTVFDGTGSPGRVTDVAVRGDTIVAIGDDLGIDAHRVIDVAGRAVTPGFIDIHTHSDLSALRDPACESKVRQGVTTDVTGNCGASPYPIASEHRAEHLDMLEGRGIGEKGLELTWSDIESYAAVADRRTLAFNLAPLVGHNTLRTAGMGLDQRPPTPAELATMQQLLDEQLQQGAFGFSTGLTLVPGAYAAEDEVVALLEVVAKHDALYATHTRGDGKREFGGVEEAIRAASAAGARLQYSHAAINVPAQWGRAADVTGIIEEARHGGLDVMFDVYPYDASSSAMTQYLPTWVQEGGTEAMRARLSDPAVYERALTELRAGWFGRIPWYWSRVMVSKVAEPDAWAVGLSIEQAATRVGADPAEWALRLCLDHGNAARVVLFYRTEDDMKTFLAHPLSMVGSDGSAMPFDLPGEQPHPRSFGTYPRVFGRYVREQQVLSLAEAVRKSTSAVADRLQLRDRGRLAEGMVADIVVFDPDTIIDRATFENPATPPVGVEHVLVNGAVVVENGDQTDARPGAVLRRPGSRVNP
ncbi:MAG TPA: D-aminoacylase [Acidimicrobiia bacterium]|nr:D-aminoacylase [Acidimicrobiia bacterium]